jgi:hypothetical protein
MSSTESELPPIVTEHIAAVNAFDTAALIASRPDGIYESVGTQTIPFALAHGAKATRARSSCPLPR